MKSNTAVGKFKSGMDNGLLCANHHIDDLPFLFESYDSCVLLLGLVKEAASGLPHLPDTYPEILFFKSLVAKD